MHTQAGLAAIGLVAVAPLVGCGSGSKADGAHSSPGGAGGVKVDGAFGGVGEIGVQEPVDATGAAGAMVGVSGSPQAEAATATIQCRLGHWASTVTGQVWCDDVTVEALDAAF